MSDLLDDSDITPLQPEDRKGRQLTAAQLRAPLARQLDGRLVLPSELFKVHSRASASTAYVTMLCNALVEESRELRQLAEQHEANIEAAITRTRNEYLDRARNAEQVTDMYRTANTLRRQLQRALRPLGVTDEQDEEAFNNGLRFSFTIGDLTFTHEIVPPVFAALWATSREGAKVQLRRIKIDLEATTGRLTPASLAYVRQLQSWAQPAQLRTNKSFMDEEIFNQIYSKEQPHEDTTLPDTIDLGARRPGMLERFVNLVIVGHDPREPQYSETPEDVRRDLTQRWHTDNGRAHLRPLPGLPGERTSLNHVNGSHQDG